MGMERARCCAPGGSPVGSSHGPPRSSGGALEAAGAVEFRVLGPVEVWDGQRLAGLGRPKQRALLAVLLVHANQVVALDRLIEELWGEQPPPQATASLQTYISNLRRVLEPGRPARTPPRVLVTRPPGYRLVVAPTDLDAARFVALAAEGHRLLEAGRPDAAGRALRAALGLWRGPALAEVADEPFAQAGRQRLGELRLVVLEDRLAAELALGGHAAAAAELGGLVGRYPFRERLHGLLMVALYRSGRQAEALGAFQAARRTLGEELGIDPGRWLRQLEADILRQAPALDWTAPPGQAGQPAQVGAAEPPQSAPAVSPSPPAGAGELVGREGQLAVLGAAVAGAAAGRGRLVLVAGEPGIGKTRLAEEAARRAAAQGVGVVWGRCYQGEGAPPFWPWVPAGELLADVAPGELGTVLGPSGVTELLRLLQSQGKLQADDALAAARRAVPVGVRDVLQRRLARLPEQTNAVLLVAAVAGRDFHLDLVGAVTQLDGEPALEAVEAAVVAGLVAEDDQAVGRYRFAHALVGETIYAQLSRARRARLHARVGEALLRLHGPGDPGHVPELAQHAGAAVPVTGAEAALPHVLAAAGHAIARLAYEQAEQQLRRALQLLGPMPPSAERTRRELGAQVQLGNLLGQLGSPGAPDGAAVFARAAELAAEVADDPAAVPALAGVHAGSTMRAEHDRARALAERVLHGARRSNGPHALLAGHFLLGHTLCLQGELVAARDHLEAAVRLAAAMPEAAQLPGTPLVLSANGLLEIVLVLLGRHDQATKVAEAASRDIQRSHHPYP